MKNKKDKNIEDVKIDDLSKKKRSKKVVKEEKVIEINEPINEQVEVINKKQKNMFNSVEVIVIMIITALFGVFVGSVVTYFRDNGSIKTSNKDLRELVMTYHDVVDNYYGNIDSEELLEAGIKGMIDYLGDPYSSYLSPESASDFNEELEGKYVGLGAEISKNEDGNLLVRTVYEDSPAYQSGLKVDDVIYKVDDMLATDKTLTEITDYIKGGKVGTKAKLYIKRGEEDLCIEFTRGTIDLISVTGEVIEQDQHKIGLITISVFAKNSGEQFEKVYKELENEQIESLIIDVRNNNGGYVTSVSSISELFLNKKDVIFIIEDKNHQEKQLSTKNGIIKIPTVVLINGGSASASEILASSLNENLSIDLIGTQTYGKGSVQKTKVLSSGATIKYTTQKWLTPSGKTIEGEGVSPTIEVEQSKEYYSNPTKENDTQLQKAIEELLKSYGD